MGLITPASEDGSVIDQVVQKLLAIPLQPDGTLVLTTQAFGLDPVTAFFNNVLQAQSLAVAGAQRQQTTQPVGITVVGQADVLAYPELDITLTFAGQDDQSGAITIAIDATFSAAQVFPLPVVTWISLTQLGLTATYESTFGIVQFAFHGKIRSGEGAQAALIPFQLGPAAGGGWQLAFGGSSSTPVTGDQLVALVGGEAMTSFFPPALTSVLQDFGITGLDAVFDPQAGTGSTSD